MTQNTIGARTLRDLLDRGEPVTVLDKEDAKKVAGRVSPTPTSHERLVELNRSGRMLEENPAALDAVANRRAAG